MVGVNASWQYPPRLQILASPTQQHAEVICDFKDFSAQLGVDFATIQAAYAAADEAARQCHSSPPFIKATERPRKLKHGRYKVEVTPVGCSVSCTNEKVSLNLNGTYCCMALLPSQACLPASEG